MVAGANNLPPATPQYPVGQTGQTRGPQQTGEATQTPQTDKPTEADQGAHQVEHQGGDSARQVHNRPGLDLPIDLGDHFRNKEVDKAKKIIDSLTDGSKLSETDRTSKTLAFADSLRGMSDDQLLDVARYLGQRMAKLDGHDETMNAMFQNVLNQIDNKDLKGKLGGCDLKHAMDQIEVSLSNGIIDEMAKTGGSPPEKLADQVLRFDQSLQGMNDDQLLDVARHLGDMMGKTEGSDQLLGRMLMLVMDKMEHPKDLLKIPDFDKLPLPDPFPKPFPMPEPFPTPQPFKLPPDFKLPDGEPTLPPDLFKRPGPGPDFPWPGTPPIFPLPDCPPHIKTFGELSQHLA